MDGHYLKPACKIMKKMCLKKNLVRFAHNWNVGILEYWNMQHLQNLGITFIKYNHCAKNCLEPY